MRPCNSLNIFFDPEHISIAQCVTLMAEAGYRHLDFNFWDWVYRDSPLAGPDWRAWVQSAADEANRLGVVFAQARCLTSPRRTRNAPGKRTSPCGA